MALILHIETATPVCSVALSRNGETLGFQESGTGQSHATGLTVYIRELLKEHRFTADDLDAISLSMGPGSYTGLRIGASVAKGLAYGTGTPLIGIPTLESLSRGFLSRHPEAVAPAARGQSILLCPMLDARRMEVYTALFDTQLREVSPVEAMILEPGSFGNQLEKSELFFFGNGSAKASGMIRHPNARFFEDLQLSALFQAELAEFRFARKEFLDTAYFEPHYLKEFLATIPKNKILG
jgi:tRNA threonylcarbamoyladenosine biosynthesis protein TsaB